MQIPPVHNSITQWDKDRPIFLNIFDTTHPHFFYITQDENNKKPTPFTTTTYEMYMKDVSINSACLYVPTTATTPEEALQLHPELFI